MKKYQFQKEIKGQWNAVRVVDGNTIARVCWFNKSWLLVENGKTFKEVSNRDYKPLASFVRADDLYTYLYSK